MSLKNNRNTYAYNNVYIIKTLQNTQLGCWENRFSRETEVSLLFFFILEPLQACFIIPYQNM